MPLAEISRACKLWPGFASWSDVFSDKFASVSMSPVAMVREFAVSTSTLCSQLKVSQKSVLRRILLQNPKVPLLESFAGISMLSNGDIVEICSTAIYFAFWPAQ